MTDSGGLALSDFAKSSGRWFLMFREDPDDHWALGGVIGVAMHVGDVMVDEETHDRLASEVAE